MSFRLTIRSRARDDIRAARDWYEAKSPGVGSRFGAEVDAVTLSIGDQPLIYAKIYHDIRRAMTRRFPYAIYFIVEGDRVAVLRVLHQARDPREWRTNR
ncbi:MAG: type II toxin-antitoxin system RelE/ParE family toxin [Thermoanaerobaculia bacterium]